MNLLIHSSMKKENFGKLAKNVVLNKIVPLLCLTKRLNILSLQVLASIRRTCFKMKTNHFRIAKQIRRDIIGDSCKKIMMAKDI